MAKWIPVHLSYTKELVWLNASLIWRITSYRDAQQKHPAKSMILKSDISDDYICVTETLDELMALINKASLLAAQISGET
jgi:hypothetical protein